MVSGAGRTGWPLTPEPPATEQRRSEQGWSVAAKRSTPGARTRETRSDRPCTAQSERQATPLPFLRRRETNAVQFRRIFDVRCTSRQSESSWGSIQRIRASRILPIAVDGETSVQLRQRKKKCRQN